MAKDKQESIDDYYQRRPEAKTDSSPLTFTDGSHINVFFLDGAYVKGPYKRRNFYMVALILNESSVQINGVWHQLRQPALIYSTPATYFEWRCDLGDRKAWVCLFNDNLIRPNLCGESLNSFSLIHINENPVFLLNDRQLQEVTDIYMKMKSELESDYQMKKDLLRNYVSVLIHFGNKILAKKPDQLSLTASSRILSNFLDLLNQQFADHNPEKAIELKSAADFANRLAVHINHLNHAVSETTGKTTTEIIAQRILAEALYKLQYTKLTITQISFSLGFREVPYFHRFFKKRHGVTPGNIRRSVS
ncbi:helix-turn-helix domain-containing protein [Mucilaginibacter endophyticus]|uniref:helix-turn-helix domain-containing protein n=1 Tax=Mucilaginibacter endophyticus TaxID=2675003 RepID=UPI000E0D630A|nr:helix-turn-helix domain-containing protein [Mucilaginibacter endophyticus]